MASCPSCKKAKQRCPENCTMKEHFPVAEDYDAVHEVFDGPKNIEKLLKNCADNYQDTLEAARCMVLEARARLDEPEGGAWATVEALTGEEETLTEQVAPLTQEVEALTAQVQALTLHLEQLQEEAIAQNLVLLHNANIRRVPMLQKRLNAADFGKNNLFLLRTARTTGSHANLPSLNGVIYRLGENDQREDLPMQLTVGTNAKDFVVLHGWNAYVDEHELVAGDTITLQKILAPNEDFLVISHQKQEAEG